MYPLVIQSGYSAPPHTHFLASLHAYVDIGLPRIRHTIYDAIRVNYRGVVGAVRCLVEKAKGGF